MCEPAHSIIQYPTRNPRDDDSFGGGNSAMPIPMDRRLQAGLGPQIMEIGRKIGEWFHFSKIGNGHTEAIQLSGRASLLLPAHTKY